MTLPAELRAEGETFSVDGEFVIARGARRETRVVTVELEATLRGSTVRGWGESVPYPHYGESVDSVLAQIRSTAPQLARGVSRHELLELLPAGAARAALDAALWHLEQATEPTEIVSSATPSRTSRTLSLGEPEAMAREAARWADTFGALKLKLDGTDDPARVAAVRAAAPQATLLADANEAWSPQRTPELCRALAAEGVALIEQPLPPHQDDVLAEFEHPVPIYADEAFHTTRDLARVERLYDGVNLKLEKTGGLTHALEALRAARDRNLEVMVGCMLCTSLGIAPALHLAGQANWVDLDAPYLLAEDRAEALELGGGAVSPNPRLWPVHLALDRASSIPI